MFFSFEGIDGSGKSTQARLLADALRARDREVVEVREPGGTALGERVRAVLLDSEAVIVPRAELLLFLAARAQVVDEVVGPALARGAVVVADRYVDSSVAYQGAGRALAGAALSVEALNDFATAHTLPVRTYLIDVPLGEAGRRRGRRAAADRMEAGDDPFFERVRGAYLDLAAAHADRVLVLDGTDPIDAVHAAILRDALAALA